MAEHSQKVYSVMDSITDRNSIIEVGYRIGSDASYKLANFMNEILKSRGFSSVLLKDYNTPRQQSISHFQLGIQHQIRINI